MSPPNGGTDSPKQELRIVLTVDDHGRAVTFYRDVLGLAQLADWSSDQGKVVLLDGGHATLELIDERQAALIDEIEVGARVSGPVRLAIATEDLLGRSGQVDSAGGDRLADPVDTPWGDRNLRVRAPDGMQLTLFSPGSE